MMKLRTHSLSNRVRRIYRASGHRPRPHRLSPVAVPTLDIRAIRLELDPVQVQNFLSLLLLSQRRSL